MYHIVITDKSNLETIDINLQSTTQVLDFISLINLPQNDKLFVSIEYVAKERS